ncbi:hypothetical protein EXIGLDRAFT_106459 [Exidia glandulosa HHB12029]|uniref:Uncharacterized protein n=1 Tax=Exidia glandulosa HHB12029 TaxID=1314781 RepID=A0A165GSH7_EXIGL|nr:hypothetical protein EXIGLDRAFT_106459 [Exidia glandulosa HHB12029]
MTSASIPYTPLAKDVPRTLDHLSASRTSCRLASKSRPTAPAIRDASRRPASQEQPQLVDTRHFWPQSASRAPSDPTPSSALSLTWYSTSPRLATSPALDAFNISSSRSGRYALICVSELTSARLSTASRLRPLPSPSNAHSRRRARSYRLDICSCRVVPRRSHRYELPDLGHTRLRRAQHLQIRDQTAIRGLVSAITPLPRARFSSRAKRSTQVLRWSSPPCVLNRTRNMNRTLHSHELASRLISTALAKVKISHSVRSMYRGFEKTSTYLVMCMLASFSFASRAVELIDSRLHGRFAIDDVPIQAVLAVYGAELAGSTGILDLCRRERECMKLTRRGLVKISAHVVNHSPSSPAFVCSVELRNDCRFAIDDVPIQDV